MRIRNCLVGCSGGVKAINKFLKWFAKPTTDFPEFFDNEDYEALVLKPNGVIEIWEDGAEDGIVCRLPYWSIGSGSEYALGALYKGHSLEEAMDTAHFFDTNTGEDIVVEYV